MAVTAVVASTVGLEVMPSSHLALWVGLGALTAVVVAAIALPAHPAARACSRWCE